MSQIGFAEYSYLVVDDDQFICGLVAGLLKKIGVGKIEIAHNGQQAIQYLDKGVMPDIIICDLNMPDFNGIEFLRYLADTSFDGGIILVSGSDKIIRDAASKLGRARALDMIATLPKPFTQEDLILALSSYDKNSRISSA